MSKIEDLKMLAVRASRLRSRQDWAYGILDGVEGRDPNPPDKPNSMRYGYEEGWLKGAQVREDEDKEENCS